MAAGDPDRSPSRTVLVPRSRVVRWCENFESRHGGAAYDVIGGGLRCLGADGATATLLLPFGRQYDGPPVARTFADEAHPPTEWGVLLVRKGGFAVGHLRGADVVASKVGQRHVQGRSKAGGQSQQRFARRRENQAREAYEAAAGHCHRLLVLGASRLSALVCGGDRQAVDAVLADPRLATLPSVRTGPWLAVPDPRRSVLEQAMQDAMSVVAEVHS